jgi:hypothetical protein
MREPEKADDTKSISPLGVQKPLMDNVRLKPSALRGRLTLGLPADTALYTTPGSQAPVGADIGHMGKLEVAVTMEMKMMLTKDLLVATRPISASCEPGKAGVSGLELPR